MKTTTQTAEAMTDQDLVATCIRLRKEIPAAQALLSAIKFELRRRKKRNEHADLSAIGNAYLAWKWPAEIRRYW